LTHGLVGVSLVQLAPRTVSRWKVAVVFGVLAVAPDVDLVAFKVGIPYGDLLGHRGLSHSLLVALVLALLGTSAIFIRSERQSWSAAVAIFGVSFVAVASHGLLDAATNGGLGVGFLLPFHEGRFFLPGRPIIVSPIDPYTLANRLGVVLASEIRWVWCPVLVGSLLFHTARWKIMNLELLSSK